MHRILLVDDEENVLKALRRELARADREIEGFNDPREALKRASTSTFDLILSDYRMPEIDGVQFLREVKELQPETMRLIISGMADFDALMGAINEAEIFRFITKPWQEYELQVAIDNALRFHDMIVQNRRLADRVREQEAQLSRQDRELRRLEEEHPGITQVDWAPDGSILLDENEV